MNSRFTFVENTISTSSKVTRTKFLGSNGLFCFISIHKFGSFKNSFAMITSLSGLNFRSKRFILLIQRKVNSMNYGSSTNSWEPWRRVRFVVVLSMRDIYINYNLDLLRKFTSSSRSMKLKDILPWNISQMIMKTIAIGTRILIIYAIKLGFLM